ncbi:aspartate-semialdehyde dehydrogenase [Erythrobacter sp. SDW2]|uniref:aspartate-semialdehyde dehydrogenase n=1 Tax=Erythrobacter sp. SDW2 TaxID=2907154 RepID=UPI001F308D7B|nr:aspartate-semialdehyde dehydrogenase [Erythrobacter sp. SDW2]UIP05541.1 aspartate-semialdehyde dehydrogenase [Erythrobacter sp. SDW2]
MQRSLLCGIVVSLALAGCGSEVTPPAASDVAAASQSIVLGGGGFAAGDKTIAFSQERAEAEAALASVMGEPEGRDENRECGAGPMQFTSYPGGLTANFQQDRLVGWFYNEANPKVALENGITVGTSRDRITASPQFLPIEGSTLGEEFALGEAVGGFLEGDKVTSLYAGVNCFFR